MAGRRSSQLNRLFTRSDQKFLVATHQNNAEVTGLRFGWFVMQYDSAIAKFRVKLIESADDDPDVDQVAESAELAGNTLPDTISLAEVGGSGISATITITGIRT